MDLNGLKRTSTKNDGSGTSEADSTVPYLPVIKKADITKLVPKYASVLEDAVTMDDLDQLQQDLEKLLSSCAVRHRLLKSEEERRDKKGKQYDKTSLKRKRPDEKLKYKDPKNGTRIIKKHYSLPVNNLIGEPLRHEVPKVNLPKNDTSDKFWNSIEPYCSDLCKDDVAFLDNLIQECSKEIDVKIPELGGHYTNEWNEESPVEDQAQGRSPKSKIVANNDLRKNGLTTFSSPITHRLLALLIEQRVTPLDDKVKCKKYNPDLNLLKAAGAGGKAGICMDRRLQKELVEQGILNVEDLPKTTPEDEILTEIKKCQQELATVNEYNLEELNKLRTIVAKDCRRQEVKEALDKVDSQVLEMYNKLLITKQKHVQQTEDEDMDKNGFSKQISKEFEAQADAVLKQQIILHREITELDMLVDFLKWKLNGQEFTEVEKFLKSLPF